MAEIVSKEASSDSSPEKDATGDRRSLMELSTCLGVIATIPALSSRPRLLASAVRLGRAFDDVFDEALDRRSAQRAMKSPDNSVALKVNFQQLLKYQTVWDHLTACARREISSEAERERVLNNTKLFVNSIAAVENAVLPYPSNKWTIDFVRQYREAICLLWAVYFNSLSPDESFNMQEFPTDAGIGGPMSCYKSVLESDTPVGKRIRKLFYGSLVYQIMGDKVSLKDRSKFIPGFGTVAETDASKLKSLQESYIRSARSLGMSLLEELGLVHVFPKVRRALNILDSKKVPV